MTSPGILQGGELGSKTLEPIRVPLDGLCRSIRRIPNFLMGVVCVDGLPASVQSRLAYELAVRIAERTGRTTAFIDGTHGSPADGWSTEETSVTRWSWERIDQEYPAGSPEYKQALKELSALPVLRQQHGMTVLDLDGMDSFRSPPPTGPKSECNGWLEPCQSTSRMGSVFWVHGFSIVRPKGRILLRHTHCKPLIATVKSGVNSA
jgi:hypothetical protein